MSALGQHPAPTAPTAPTALTALTARRLPPWTTWVVLAVAMLASGAVFLAAGAAGPIRVLFVGGLLFATTMVSASFAIEGSRRAKDRLVTILVSGAFVLAVLPLISLLASLVRYGTSRLDARFLTQTMRNVVGEGGGVAHALIGTAWITGVATVISVPVAILAGVYLVEYAHGRAARTVTNLVDVMTGIPSIVAGLFAYALFSLLLGPGTKSGLAGTVSLCVLMIPMVVRSVEESLREVPDQLREAAYALGVPRWLTVVKVVLPSASGGLVAGALLAVARVIGETAPLLIAAGFTHSLNHDPLNGPMATLPVFVYRSVLRQGVPASAYLDRAWAGALILTLIVMVLTVAAHVVAARSAAATDRAGIRKAHH